MKKVMLSICLLVFIFQATAQDSEISESTKNSEKQLNSTNKGNFILSGGFGLQFFNGTIDLEYDGQSEGDIKVNSFSFTPSTGYFVADNLALGLLLSIASTSEKDQGYEINNKSFAAMPTLIYYFPVKGNFRPFGQVAIGHMSSSIESGSSNNFTKIKFSGLSWNIGGGASYFVNNTISFDMGLSFNKANLKDGADEESVRKIGNFGANIGISIFL
jgi:outer membrane protein